ncbi:MAG: hypothetical protein U0172_09605 [Nitrospiraceae bacterium]
MRHATKRLWLALVWCAIVGAAVQAPPAQAEDWGWKYEGTAGDEQFVMGFRAGPGFMTQSTGTSKVGPTVNFSGMYTINAWFRAGMMLDWDHHHIQRRGGSLNTVSFMPAVLEFRPGRFGPVMPYGSMGIGVNINDDNQSDSVAWRTAAGLDYPLTNWFPNAPKSLMLNTEAAWKRNRANNADFSTLNWLFGLRYGF